MKKALLIVAVLLPALTFAQGMSQSAQESAIYDSAGKKIFSHVLTGDVEESTDINGVKKVYRLGQLTDLETGATYTYSDRWRQTVSDGGVVMEYHYNKRLWYWVEGQGLALGDSVKKEQRRRIYDLYEDRMNTPEQGGRQILKYKEGNFVDEMGRPLYAARWRGSIPEWVQVLLLHKYYEQMYLSDAFEEIRAWREAEAIRFGDSNSLVLDMLASGHKNETSITTLTGKRYRMLYFADIDGQLITPSKEQLKLLKNKWLVSKDETSRTSSGLVIPRAAFRLSRSEAKKRGFADVAGTDFVLELKPVPEFLAEFRSAISQTVAAVEKKAPSEAARQAQVDSLSVGILAGSLKPGSGNGFRTDATFNGPADIAVDSRGNVFVVDGHAVRKITPDGQVSAVAGGARGYIDGQGITARFFVPAGIAIGLDDNLYIADSGNHRIRKVSPDGYVDTLAGESLGYQDGQGRNARFNYPKGIAVDAAGNVYVGDEKNSKVRKILPDGTVTTIGDTSDIKFTEPRGIAVDQAGFVYVLDGGTLKRIAPDNGVVMMAADMRFGAAADSQNRALFSAAGGIALDGEGNLLVSKKDDHAVIRIAPNGETTTIAENTAEFWLGRPNAVAIGTNGNIYLADSHNHLVHQVTPAGNTGPLPGAYISEPEPEAPAAEPKRLSRDERKALLATTKKQAKSDPQAMYELARIYADAAGAGDAYRSLSSYKKAAKKGHAGAQYELALLHLDGTVSYSLSITNGDVAAAERKQMAKRQVNAAKLLTQSADQGYGPAQYALGHAFLRGEGVTQNTDTGIDWLSKAGAQGLLEAQLDLGGIYRDRNTPEDSAKAIEWYTMAAEQGDAYASVIKNSLLGQTDPNGAGQQVLAEAGAKAEQAFSYYTGEGVEQDYVAAEELFYESAMLGNTTSQWMLGLMCLNGEGMYRNLEQSVDWFAIASELNHADAQFYLGLMYERGYGTAENKALAYDWYSRAAEQGQVNAQFALGMLYFDSRSNKAGTEEARNWLEAAAEQGDAHALFMMAGMYLDDKGVDGGRARAAELFEKAAAQGHIYAAGRL